MATLRFRCRLAWELAVSRACGSLRRACVAGMRHGALTLTLCGVRNVASRFACDVARGCQPRRRRRARVVLRGGHTV